MQALILIGASAGGMDVLSAIFAGLPASLPAPVLVVTHLGARKSLLPEILGKTSALPVRFAEEREPVRPGRILLAPPDRHMLVANTAGQPSIELTRGPKENHTRPAIDPLFRSAAAFGEKVVGVILSGYLDDGTAGLQAIKACGGKALVQEPQEAHASSMPQSAIDHVAVDWRLPVAEIAPALLALASGKPLALQQAQPVQPVPHWIAVENRFARGVGNMEQLEKIATPSTFTCPECQGTLWELNGQQPQRFRCHTGSPRRDLDLYAVWKFDAKNQLRLAVSNLLAQDFESDTIYTDASGTIARNSVSPSSPQARATLEMKF